MLYDGRQYEPNPVRDHILEAANLIADNGWCRGRSHKKTIFGNNQYCMMGALHSVTLKGQLKNRDTYVASYQISKYLAKKYNIDTTVIEWNDNKATSKKQVIEVMREAAYAKETVNVV